MRVLRVGQRLSRTKLAQQLNTDDSQIERIEKGQIDTRSSLLFAVICAVHGSPDHVMKLILSDTADEADGRACAEAHLQSQAAHSKGLDERERLVQQLVDQVLSEPRIVDQLLGYSDRLREELREARETAAGATP